VLTASNQEEVRKEILPAEYATETRGKRRIAAAAPSGEGKYSIVKHDNHTEMAYVLELPALPSPAQKEFEINKERSKLHSIGEKSRHFRCAGLRHLKKESRNTCRASRKSLETGAG
jgi:hypothetical protein